MSDGTNAASGGAPHGSSDGSHMVDNAKREASDLKDTATDAAKDVAGTAKDEVASVAHETKVQAKDLFEQGRQELTEQASKQQQRIAGGLDSLGSELSLMARNSEGTGMASDLVQKASDKIAGAATWLGNREPSGVLQDVKTFARRRPGAFIGAALLAGIIVGRLTRALAANAKESSSAESDPTANASRVGSYTPTTAIEPPVPQGTPLYSESAARQGGTGPEVTYERPDAL